MEYMLGWEVYEYSVSREWGWGKTNQCHPSSSWQYLSMYVDVLNVYLYNTNRDIYKCRGFVPKTLSAAVASLLLTHS